MEITVQYCTLTGVWRGLILWSKVGSLLINGLRSGLAVEHLGRASGRTESGCIEVV
jgi:hypothetical protein